MLALAFVYEVFLLPYFFPYDVYLLVLALFLPSLRSDIPFRCFCWARVEERGLYEGCGG